MNGRMNKAWKDGLEWMNEWINKWRMCEWMWKVYLQYLVSAKYSIIHRDPEYYINANILEKDFIQTLPTFPIQRFNFQKLYFGSVQKKKTQLFRV